MLFLISLLSYAVTSAASVDSAQICKGADISGSPPNEFDTCIDESYAYTTEDDAAILVVHLLDLVEGKTVKLEIFDPSNNVVDSDTGTLPMNLSSYYDHSIVVIAGQNRALGTYTAKLTYDNNVLVSKTFTISAPDYTCENNGYFCCPSNKKCMGKPDPKYTCTYGTCCNPGSCVDIGSGELSVQTILDCSAANLQECFKVIGNVYNYSIHGALENLSTIELFFRDIDVDCFNKKDVAIGVYDEVNSTNGTSAWRYYNSSITKLMGNYYSVSAKIDYVGYIAVVKSPKCVPLDCFIPGFHTTPFDGMVMVGNQIRFDVCQITKYCNAVADGYCDLRCTEGLDPDCGDMTCTSASGNCCNPEKDGMCDLDCAPGIDPDCADEGYMGGLCYPSTAESRGFGGCDIHCTGADAACTDHSQYCNPSPDGTCDPKCTKLANGVGYLDVDCCTEHGIQITSAPGDCCNTAADDICDPDCLPGLDPDCRAKKVKSSITSTPNCSTTPDGWCDPQCPSDPDCITYGSV